jgi:hypothetical protein
MHKPGITKVQPRLKISDVHLHVSGFLVSSWTYEKARIRESIMAIVCGHLGCFEERQGLVNGFKSREDREWCGRVVQGKEFVVVTGLHSLRL